MIGRMPPPLFPGVTLSSLRRQDPQLHRMMVPLLDRHPRILDLPLVRQFILGFLETYRQHMKANPLPVVFCSTDELFWLATRRNRPNTNLCQQLSEAVVALGTEDEAAARALEEAVARWVAWVRPRRRLRRAA